MTVKFLIDTGASVNVLPKDIFDKINRDGKIKIKRSNALLKSFNETEIKTYGKADVECSRNNITQILEFYIVGK